MTKLPDKLNGLRVVALLAMVGCGGDEVSVYRRFEALPFRESLVEMPLGEFAIPVPVVAADEAGGLVRTNLLQTKFELYCQVKPAAESEVRQLAQRNRGELRDRVIRVCRNSSLEDLLDPQLSTFRSRVLDAIQPLFGGVTLRGVLVPEMNTDPL